MKLAVCVHGHANSAEIQFSAIKESGEHPFASPHAHGPDVASGVTEFCCTLPFFFAGTHRCRVCMHLAGVRISALQARTAPGSVLPSEVQRVPAVSGTSDLCDLKQIP